VKSLRATLPVKARNAFEVALGGFAGEFLVERGDDGGVKQRRFLGLGCQRGMLRRGRMWPDKLQDNRKQDCASDCGKSGFIHRDHLDRYLRAPFYAIWEWNDGAAHTGAD
jgi:hypothetical protein